MISKKMQDAINKQINEEMFSAYLYLSMSTYFESVNLKGFANWMRVQYQEESFHAMKFFDYVLERGGTVTLKQIEAPKNKWKGVLDVFQETYKHEQKITSLINNLVTLAMQEKDYAANSFLQWYVNEQVEEEANVTDLLEQLKMIEGKGPALFMLDRELKTRVFTPPAATQP
jgi:ferritin